MGRMLQISSVTYGMIGCTSFIDSPSTKSITESTVRRSPSPYRRTLASSRYQSQKSCQKKS